MGPIKALPDSPLAEPPGMNCEIIRVEPHPIDDSSLVVTLREQPNLMERLFGRTECVHTYHGYPGNWYTEHMYQPAPASIATLLDRIARNTEFRHLRIRSQASVV